MDLFLKTSYKYSISTVNYHTKFHRMSIIKCKGNIIKKFIKSYEICATV